MKKPLLIGALVLGISLLPALALAQTSFVPLTDLPGLPSGNSGAPSLPTFLQDLYNICIGIAVVIAVLQLVRAGITYMTAGGNIGSTEQARHLIVTSILGLVLVLSPYIVFSVINPQILNLDLTTDVNNLQVNTSGTPTGTNPSPIPGANYGTNLGPSDNQNPLSYTETGTGNKDYLCEQDSCDSAKALCTGSAANTFCRDNKTGQNVKDISLVGSCPQGSYVYVQCSQ